MKAKTWDYLKKELAEFAKDNEENLINFFETLEEDDDVQNVFSNAKLNIT